MLNTPHGTALPPSEPLTPRLGRPVIVDDEDVLTGLPNRARLLDHLQEILLTAAARAHPVALLVVNLDRFVEINSTLGHHHGAVLLQHVGQRLQEVLPDVNAMRRKAIT